MLSGEAKEEILNSEDGLKIYVLRVGNLTRLMMEEAHSSRYFIHLDATKKYLGLKQHY